MKCKRCQGTEWELVWAHCLVEEGTPVNMYQCQRCARIVMASQDWREDGGTEA